MKFTKGTMSLKAREVVNTIRKYKLENAIVVSGSLADEILGYNHIIGTDCGFNRIDTDEIIVDAYGLKAPIAMLDECYGIHLFPSVFASEVISHRPEEVDEDFDILMRSTVTENMTADDIITSIQSKFKRMGYNKVKVKRVGNIYCVDERGTDMLKYFINRVRYLARQLDRFIDDSPRTSDIYFPYITESINNIVDALLTYRLENTSFTKLKMALGSYDNSYIMNALMADVETLVSYMQKHLNKRTGKNYKEVDLKLELSLIDFKIVANVTNMETGKPVNILIDKIEDLASELYARGSNLNSTNIKLYGEYVAGNKVDTIKPIEYSTGKSYTFLNETLTLIKKCFNQDSGYLDGYSCVDSGRISYAIRRDCKYWIDNSLA